MTKTLADMTPEERDECIGMWCDYDFPDGTTHRAILLSRGSSNTATVIDTTQCGVPQQWLGGTLIFKWNEYQIPVREVLACTPHKPLYGHRSGRQSKTHWIAFIKEVVE